MNEPRSLTLYCANGCGRKAAAHGQVQVRTDGEVMVTSRLVCLECLAAGASGSDPGTTRD